MIKNTVNYDTINQQQNIKHIFTMSKTNFTRKYKESKYLTPTRYSKSGIEMYCFKIEKNFYDKGFKRSVTSL